MTRTPLVEGTGLQIIDNFEAVDEWLLGPETCCHTSKVAHWGVAGRLHDFFHWVFRAPLLSDMLSDLAVELSAQGLDQHYRDRF